MINPFKSKPQTLGKFPNPIVNPECSELEVNKWVVSDFVLKNLIPTVGINPFPLDELMLMATAVTYFKPNYIFEWGTHVGKSARVFYETIKAFDINSHIHSIDLPDDVVHIEHPKHQRGEMVKGLKEITLYQGDGIAKAMEIYKTLKDNPSVLFFVDGDHSYDSVKKEFSMILKEVKNPVVLLHDTLLQDEKSGYNIGPYHAIKDVLAGKENEYRVISTQTGLPGMTLVCKR